MQHSRCYTYEVLSVTGTSLSWLICLKMLSKKKGEENSRFIIRQILEQNASYKRAGLDKGKGSEKV